MASLPNYLPMPGFDELHSQCERLLAELEASPDLAKRRLLLREFRRLLEDADERSDAMRIDESDWARRFKEES